MLFLQESTEPAMDDSGYMGSSQHNTGCGGQKSKKMKCLVADHLERSPLLLPQYLN